MIDHDDVDDDHDDDRVTEIVSFYVIGKRILLQRTWLHLTFLQKDLTPFEFAEAKAMAEKAQADAMAMVQSKCVLQWKQLKVQFKVIIEFESFARLPKIVLCYKYVKYHGKREIETNIIYWRE